MTADNVITFPAERCRIDDGLHGFQVIPPDPVGNARFRLQTAEQHWHRDPRPSTLEHWLACKIDCLTLAEPIPYAAAVRSAEAEAAIMRDTKVTLGIYSAGPLPPRGPVGGDAA